MTLKYSSVKGFWEFMGLNNSVLDYLPDTEPQREVITTLPTANAFQLKHMSFNPDTLILYKGETNTALTVTTHYTVDVARASITLTSAGVTFLSTESLTAYYEFCELEKQALNYTETAKLLARSESWVESTTNTVFANQTDAEPNYEHIIDEKLSGQGYVDNTYTLSHYPLIKLETTVATSFSTGTSSLVLSDATGFPASGTIYVGGNKVTYSAKSTNTLTVPTSTPSIDSGAIVRGEVIEVSTDGAGFSPSFVVLRPDADYSVDYNTGDITIMSSDLTSYFRLDSSRPVEGVDNRVRTTYLTAWHLPNKKAEVPVELEEIVYLKAGLLLLNRTMLKANVNLRENFNASNFNITEQELMTMLDPYRISFIGKA